MKATEGLPVRRDTVYRVSSEVNTVQTFLLLALRGILIAQRIFSWSCKSPLQQSIKPTLSTPDWKFLSVSYIDHNTKVTPHVQLGELQVLD